VRTVRLTTAAALVRWLVAQRTIVDGREAPLFAGVYAIFGHGNVTSLGLALEAVQEDLPTWRGQSEEGMALAAVAFAKARRRRQVMVATSSIGPGATNMVTAAACAHANRLPLLILSGDTFASRIPDPALQQIEDFGTPSTTVNDAFRPVTRYWDRIVKPEQLAHSLPQVVATLLDPADCGPAFLGLPQDVQAESLDFPERLFEPVVHEIPRPPPDARRVAEAAEILARARMPLIIAGGGVHYSLAEEELGRFAEEHQLPVTETVAGKSVLTVDHPLYVGPIGVTGCDEANRLAAEADLVLAVGTRLQDFTTGSWTVFQNEDLRIVALNAARYDSVKHRALPVVGDARESLGELQAALGDWRAPDEWARRAGAEAESYARAVDARTAPTDGVPSYAQVVGAVNRLAGPDDYVLTAAGGLPGELNVNWRSKGVATFDCEYGYSCMGYEIAGGWGAARAREQGEVIVLVGDGSYLMLNSDLYSSVLTGHKLIVVVCDNGGYAVIERLQRAQGGASFNNMWETTRVADQVRVDFAANARSLGCESEEVSTIAELDEAFGRARSSRRTSVIVVPVEPQAWSEGGAFWEVGVPEVSDREAVRAAREALEAGKRQQRVGW
jgi:3D-(3,5/4)-trihydroxycyclohexane-1,2-dione acylhydrolase (decyclizing)